MKLNHLNLPVANVAETSTFFENFFNFKCVEVKGDQALAVLSGVDNFVLVLMSESFNRNGNVGYPDAFHIGFSFEKQEEVNDLYKRLTEGGIKADREPGSMRGVYGFYFTAPGNILTEVSCPL